MTETLLSDAENELTAAAEDAAADVDAATDVDAAADADATADVDAAAEADATADVDAALELSAQSAPPPMSGESLLHALEALLFVACEPLTPAELANLLEVRPETAEQAAEQLCQRYRDKGMILRRVAGGYQFVTPEAYAYLVERLYRPKYQQLSAAALEALAIIAYKQPITRAEVAAVRQVDSDSVINTLLERKLIREVGRVNAAGRAILYGTGEDFLTFFGLNSLSDLPPLPEDQQPTAEDIVL